MLNAAYNCNMTLPEKSFFSHDWQFQALAGIRDLQILVNEISSDGEDRLTDLLARVMTLLDQLFPDSKTGFFTGADRPEEYRSIFPPENDIEGALFPTAFIVQMTGDACPVYSDTQPPALFLPEQPATACLPLAAGGERFGVMICILAHRRAYTPAEKLVLEEIAQQVTTAWMNVHREARTQKLLTRRDEELASVNRAGVLISSRLELEETLVTILQMALELTSAQYGIFRLLDRSGKLLVTRAFAGESMASPLVAALPVEGNTITGWVARNRQPICIPDLRADRWREIYYPLDALTEMRSELAVPLVSPSGRLEGVLNLESPLVNGFSAQDSHLLQSLAAQAVIAIEEARLLDAIQEISRSLLTLTHPEVLNRIAQLGCDLLFADACTLWLVQDGKLMLQSSAGNILGTELLDLDDSFPGETLRARSVQVLKGTGKGQAYQTGLEQPAVGMAVPLSGGNPDSPVGVLAVYSLGEDSTSFTDSDWNKKVLTLLAQYISLSIQNAGRQEALQIAREQHAVAETFAAVGDVAANVLHNLNNKVGTIPVRIQGIRGKRKALLEEDAYLAGNLDEIEQSANQAMRSVRENLSQLRPIVLSEVDVSTCVQAAVEESQLPEGIRVQMENLEQLPPVWAANASLTLVFTNLLGNAGEAMQGQGWIRITGKVLPAMLEITVHDSGPGIPPELQERIFEVDYSGKRNASRNRLGFGLWWVKTVMARLGGSVGVVSDELGAAFVLRLPLAGG